MINESANLPSDGGSKTVELSTDLDNPSNLNFWEPEEEQQANPEQGAEGIESGTDEAQTGQEADANAELGNESNESDNGDEGNDAPDANSLDETLVTLKGGEQVPVKELKLGYMRERDYRIKTQEVANKGRSLEDMSNRVVKTATVFANYLVNQLPPEPHPTLAIQNPNEYTRQKAIYDTAAAQVQQILNMANEPHSIAQEMTQGQRSELLAAENAKLEQAFPQTATNEGREAFFEDCFDVARQLGFSDPEFSNVTDHRYFKLAYYARLGMEAEAAKAKALNKVNNAPPPAPRGKAQAANAQKVRNNQNAMQRLGQTGSMKDALQIEFD